MAQNDAEGAPEESKEQKEPPKSLSKVVRVMTVFAYLSSVSFAAVLLSIYYLFIWKSPVLSDLEDINVHHQQGESFDYQVGHTYNDSIAYNSTGGSGISVNDNDIQLPASSDSYTADQTSSEALDSTIAEPTKLYNSTVHHNGTTETTTSSINESSTVERSILTV